MVKSVSIRLTLVAVIAVLAASCATKETTASPEPKGSAPSKSTKTMIAYVSADDHDVYVYDFETRRTRRLTHDGDEVQQANARLIDSTHVSYLVDDGIEIVDLVTLKRTTIVHPTRQSVNAVGRGHDWTTDGSRVAYLREAAVDANGATSLDLVIAKADGERLSSTRLPIAIPEGLGGYCFRRETRVSFAGDGSLVTVELYAGTPKNAVILDGNGKLIGGPRSLRGVRIAPDATVIAERDGRWVRIDPQTDEAKPLPVPAGTARVELSPDGGRLAFERGMDDPAAHVVDLRSGKSTEIAKKVAGPAWIDGGNLLVLTGDEAACWEGGGIPATLQPGSSPESLGIAPVESFDLAAI